MTSHLFLYFCFSIGDLQMVRNASILETKKFVALSYMYYKLLFKKHYSGYVVSWKLKIFNFFSYIYTNMQKYNCRTCTISNHYLCTVFTQNSEFCNIVFFYFVCPCTSILKLACNIQ